MGTWAGPITLVVVLFFILRRPWNLNEAFPAVAGAVVVLALGIVNWTDLKTIFSVVSGAGITILSTMVMSSILDRAGFFRWAAVQMERKAHGNGVKLFGYTLVLCFGMTLFFNNDGSILITTPIVLEMMRRLRFTKKQALPYLVGAALVASASSAPIGVSNLANLIALKIVGLNLNTYAQFMFFPSILGILVCCALLYYVFRRDIPREYGKNFTSDEAAVRDTHAWQEPLIHEKGSHQPLPIHPPPDLHVHRTHGKSSGMGDEAPIVVNQSLFIVGISVVIAVRVGFFIGALFGIPVQFIAVLGAAFLLGYYAFREPHGVWPILRSAPWYILVFAFGMYTLVYGLHKEGFTGVLGKFVEIWAGNHLFGMILVTGVLLTILSCFMNNLPSVMIGTIMLQDLHLSSHVLQLSYLANVLGSDVGSLLLPMGTLASLLWFHIVRKQFPFTWGDYMKVSFVVIPPSLLIGLISLYFWGTYVI